MDFEKRLSKIEAPVGHKSILSALNNHHAPTAKHCIVVADLTKKFLKSIGENENDIKKGYLAALVHDAGKLALPSELLNKKEALTNEERLVLSDHTSEAIEYLNGNIRYSEKGDRLYIDGISVFDIYTAASHHKDSKDLPYLTRAIAICDVYAALTENRAYRDPSTMREALHIMLTDKRQDYLDRSLLSKFAIFINSHEVNKQKQNVKDWLKEAEIDYKEPAIYLIQNQETEKIVNFNGFKLFPGYWYGIDSETKELVCTSGKEKNGSLKLYRASEHLFDWERTWEKESEIKIKAFNFKAPEFEEKRSLDEFIDYYIGRDNQNFEDKIVEQAYFNYVNEGLPYFARNQLENASEDVLSNEFLRLSHDKIKNNYIQQKASHMSFEHQYKFVNNEFIEQYEDELNDIER